MFNSDTDSITQELPLSAVYEITRVTKADEGLYSCVARNAAGSKEERVQVRVEEDNNIGPTRGDIPGGGEDNIVSLEKFKNSIVKNN